MPSTSSQRVFLAGASGVIGQRLIPRLIEAGYVVGGMTRSADKTELLSRLGAEPILCDVFDREGLSRAVRDFAPDVILNELTDLPDDAASIGAHAELNARIRTEGNQNLIEAARQSGSPKILAQTVAWQLPDGPGRLGSGRAGALRPRGGRRRAELWPVLRTRHLQRTAASRRAASRD